MGMAQIVDPLSGRTTSLSGAMLGRLAVFVFMAFGGMMLWIGVLIESFALWPMAETNLMPRLEGVRLFEQAFSSFATLMFMLAAPALVVVYLIDLCLGVMNRYAPQLNLLSISISVKGLGAVLVWVLLASTVAQMVHDEVAELLPGMLQALKSLIQ
jgi:flagellar biosynthesis protein FliR